MFEDILAKIAKHTDAKVEIKGGNCNDIIVAIYNDGSLDAAKRNLIDKDIWSLFWPTTLNTGKYPLIIYRKVFNKVEVNERNWREQFERYYTGNGKLIFGDNYNILEVHESINTAFLYRLKRGFFAKASLHFSNGGCTQDLLGEGELFS